VVGILIVPVMPLGLSARADERDHGHGGFDHVFIIMMENTGYNTLIGNPNAPFITFATTTTGRDKLLRRRTPEPTQLHRLYFRVDEWRGRRQ